MTLRISNLKNPRLDADWLSGTWISSTTQPSSTRDSSAPGGKTVSYAISR